MVDLLHHIGLRLRAARENADMSIEQASSTVNISLRLLENYEAGQQNISVVRLVELAEAYKVSPAWLIRGDAEVDYMTDPDLHLVSRSTRRALTEDGQRSSDGQARRSKAVADATLPRPIDASPTAHITLKEDETQRQPISGNRVDVKERIAAVEEDETRSPRSITAVRLRRSTRDQIKALGNVARRTDDTAADEVTAILTNAECESEVRAAAARALGACWNAMAVDTLITLICDNSLDSEIRCGVAYAMGAIRDSRGVEPLVAVLREPGSDTRVRCSAALALGEIGDVRAVPILKSGRWTADVGLRVSIDLALTKINALASDRTRPPTSEA